MNRFHDIDPPDLEFLSSSLNTVKLRIRSLHRCSFTPAYLRYFLHGKEIRTEGEKEREREENKNGRLSTSNSLSRGCHFAVETEKRAKLDKVRETFSCACDVDVQETDKGPSVVRWTCSVSRRDSWHDVSPRGKLFNNARPDFALARCCRMMESR